MTPPPGRVKQGKASGRRCPICRRPAVERWRPFCSQRCADIDLARWLGEAYRIAVVTDDNDDAEGGNGPPTVT